MFLYFCLWLFKSLSQMAFYFSNLILQTASLKTGLPVEVVVPRKHDFKMKLFGFTNSRIQEAYARHNIHGNVRRRKNGEPYYDYYNVYKSIDYDVHDLIGF